MAKLARQSEGFSGFSGCRETGLGVAAGLLNPKTEIRTTDYADYADDKRVPFTARVLDSSGLFRLQVFVYPCHPRHPRFQLRK
jgi:hypothetical protein